jgi:hypothetical protein
MKRDEETEKLRMKLDQARAVIEHLIGDASETGAEGKRALAYFASDDYERDFLPWPRQEAEGMRPEELNAANDG